MLQLGPHAMPPRRLDTAVSFSIERRLWSPLRHAGIAHGIEEVFGVLVSVTKTPYREARVQREAGLGFGSGLFQLAQICQRRREEEMGERVGPVVLDRAAK